MAMVKWLSTGLLGVLVSATQLGLGATATSVAAEDGEGTPPIVLELFTSQGCSSCPPADALLEDYIARGTVIALSQPVDYWDRLGWKDTFGSPKHTERQREYAAARGDDGVYTPQIVVNGRTHAVGSSTSQIDRAIADAKSAGAGSRVAVTATEQRDTIAVHIGADRSGTAGREGVLLLAVIQDQGTVAIGRGENAGRRVTYHNVVRAWKEIGSWSGQAASVKIAKSGLALGDSQSVIVLLQEGRGGPIVGAAKLDGVLAGS